MSKYEKYLNTIDSGLEWLGQIPAHWNVQYSKWLFSERNTKALPSDEMLTASQKYGVIPQKLFMELEQQKVVQVLKGHDILKRVEQDDFVISMRSFQGGIEYCPYTGAVSSAYVPLEPQGNISRTYYKYLFKSKPYIQALQTTTNLVRDGQALRYNNFIQVRLPVPQIDEANNIGLFLDHETAKIDTLIEKQQRLIELLKEKRQAVISHAVTKGLNPDVPMKDSGVEWLGEVPEHWDITKLKYYSSIQGGYAFSSTSFTEEGIQILRIGNVYQNRLALERQPTFVNKNLLQELPEFKVQRNDILMSLTGTLGKRDYGFAVKIEHDNIFLLNQRVAKLQPFTEKIDSDFLIYILWSESYLTQLYSLPSGTKQANLANSDVLGVTIAVPPSKEEQKKIAEYLNQKLKSFDVTIEKANSAINLMQERRTALISAAVTGKIDVRHWVAPTNSSNTNEAQQEVTA
ncbi:restriction endonuclease subunit S [Photobacterium leiognathi]|uniref:restriction endonuclease subunit S n=1 Tax=Photobacterium leiognathi TaxID=553611 RepID=UPI0027328D56|nr:restriction endonuclease subunit S [Photobacterium leiognathi]